MGAAAGELDLDAILDAALARLQGFVRFTGGSIALVEGDDLVIRAAKGPFEAEARTQRLHRSASASWTVIDTGASVRIPDVWASGRRTPSPGTSAIRSWLAVPIARHERAIGLLEVDSTEPDAFDASDEELLAMIARALAGPIDLAARYAEEHRTRSMRDAFSGMISHELRTPITTIYGLAHVLRQRALVMDRAAIADALVDIEAEADRLRRLTEDLLVLNRAEAGRLAVERDPLLVGRVVPPAVRAEAAVHPEHRFEVEIEPGLPLVLGDDLSVEQVVRNLVANAAKYSDPGTLVRVEVGAEDDGVAVRVLDEGPGIDDASADQLFELFYRAEGGRRAHGAGIGLFVCRELVRAMDGRTWARRRAGPGSEFGFWLPAAALDGDRGDS